MYKNSLKAKIEFILLMIENIYIIIDRHNGIVNALDDTVEARPALLMCLMQIGESLNKIDKDILEKFELLLDAKGSYDVRNFIAHDYEGVNLGLIEIILRDNLSVLEEKILKLKYEIEKL